MVSMTHASPQRDAEDADSSEDGGLPPLPQGLKNYMTPAGHARLRTEFEHLVKKERPAMVEVVAWAASNGDRSENGDYLYGKKRLREIDRRIRFLSHRLDKAEVVDPCLRGECDQVFFGATVTVMYDGEEEQTYAIVGIDEADVSRGRISWVSPLARALTKAREGDVVTLRTPAGIREIEVSQVQYLALGD